MSTPSIRFVDGDGDGDRAGDRDGAGPKALYSFTICSRLKINSQVKKLQKTAGVQN